MTDIETRISKLKAEVFGGAPEVTTAADIANAEALLEEARYYGDGPRTEVAEYRLNLYAQRLSVEPAPEADPPNEGVEGVDISLEDHVG